MSTNEATPRACAELLLATMPNLMRSIGGVLRQRRPEGDEVFNAGQAHLLGMLAHKPRSLRELAHIHHVTPSTMSRTVDLLVNRGWVDREVDPRDRRQVVLSVTPQGEAVHAEAMAALREGVADLLGQLDADARGRLYDGLQALAGLLARLEPEEGRSCPEDARPAHPTTADRGAR